MASHRFLLAIPLLLASLIAASFAQFKDVWPTKSSAAEGDDFTPVISMPLPLRYLAVAAVRADLKLSKQQAQKVDRIRAEWADTAAKGNNGLVDDAIMREKLTKGVVNETDAVLSAVQQVRLRQIMIRHRMRAHGDAAVLQVLARELALTAEQRSQLDRLFWKRVETVLEWLTSGERLQTIRREVYEANADYLQQVEQLLNQAQSAKLRGLIGEPFAAEIELQPEPIFNPQKQGAIYRKDLFDWYSFEPEFLVSAVVQKELAMSDEQIRKARTFRAEWDATVEAEIRLLKNDKEVLWTKTDQEIGVTALTRRSEAVENHLKNLLTPVQAQRFREIMIQHRLEISGICGVCSYPGVATALNLKAEQVQALRRNGNPRQILDEQQLAELQKAIGQPFKGEVKFNGRGALETRQIRVVKPAVRPVEDLKQDTIARFILTNGKRLRLTEEQTTQLMEIANDAPKIQAILHKELASLPPPTDAGGGRMNLPEVRAVEQLHKAFREQCFGLLDRQQQSLLQQMLRVRE